MLFADDPNPRPYACLLPKVKSLPDRNAKRLFLKGSKVEGCLSSILARPARIQDFSA